MAALLSILIFEKNNMADNVFTSPFPTSHDTVGASTLNAPANMPSSPPTPMSGGRRTPASRRKSLSARSTPASTTPSRIPRPARRPSELPPHETDDSSSSEANLSDYTFDLDKLSDGGSFAFGKEGSSKLRRDAVHKKIQNGSIPGTPGDNGPRDFTLNMVDLVGDVALREENANGNTGDDKQRIEENTEIEQPVDMSTPAHVLTRRRNTTKDTAQPHDCDNSPAPSRVSTPGKAGRPKCIVEKHLRGELDRLQRELNTKDDIINSTRRKLLSATNTAQQVPHLQAQLQTQKGLVEQKEARLSEYALQEVVIQKLKEQLEEKEELLEESKAEASEKKLLEEKLEKLQEEEFQSQALRDQNDVAMSELRSQLREKDEALQELSDSVTAVIQSKDSELKSKLAEVDEHKSRESEHYLEMDRLDSELESTTRQCGVLEERNTDLHKTISSLEERTSSLQSEIADVNSKSEARHDTMKKWAASLRIDVTNKDFYQIMSSVKSTYEEKEQEKASSDNDTVEKVASLEDELNEVRSELKQSTSINNTQRTRLESSERDSTEFRSLIEALRGENSRLQSNLERLKSEHASTQENMARIGLQRDEALTTVEKVYKQNIEDSSTPRCPIDHETLRRSHQAELDSLQSAHNTAISTLKDSHAETTATLQNLLSAAQSRESKLEAELRSLRTTTTSFEDRLEDMRTEKQKLESSIEAKDAASIAINEEFAKTLRRREEEWDARINRLLRDRERMSKVLMWSWGENEVGRASKGNVVEDVDKKNKAKGRKAMPKQGYKYKFVEKDTNRW